MIDKVPIQFECEGVQYDGFLTRPNGAANYSNYHLMINNFYCGQLLMTPDGWAFYGTPKTKQFDNLGQYFGDYVTAWFE